jgi:hypothetical protein
MRRYSAPHAPPFISPAFINLVPSVRHAFRLSRMRREWANCLKTQTRAEHTAWQETKSDEPRLGCLHTGKKFPLQLSFGSFHSLDLAQREATRRRS